MRFHSVDRLLDGTASLAMIVAAGVLLWTVLSDREPEAVSGSGGLERLEVAEVVDSARPASVKGDSGARVAIMEFSDFECPFCGRHAREVYPRLVEEYVDTGKVQYVFRHFPLDSHPLAIKAAVSVECAARQGKYWEMHDLLFQANGAVTETALLRHAASLGLQPEDFATCLVDNATVDHVMEDRLQGRELGVTSTPTFFFAEVRDDGTFSVLAKLSGARPYSAFQSALDDLLSPTTVASVP